MAAGPVSENTPFCQLNLNFLNLYVKVWLAPHGQLKQPVITSQQFSFVGKMQLTSADSKSL